MQIRFLLILVITLLTLQGCSSDKEKTNKEIHVGYIQSLSGLPLFVALDEGLFEKYGFEVTTTQFRTSDLATSALRTGEIDLIGIAGTTQALHLAEEDSSILRIAALYHSTIAFVSKEDSEEGLSSLSGKIIGVFPGSVFHVYVEKLLQQHGITLDEVEISPISPALQVTALDEGAVDALITLEPTGRFAVESGAGSYLIERDVFSEELLNGTPFPGGAMSLKWNDSDEDRLTLTYLDSVLTGANKIMERTGFDPSEYIQRHTSISEQYLSNLPPVDIAVVNDTTVSKQLINFIEVLENWDLVESPFNIKSVIE
ncbi:MAG: ABC transporter substrate-binding protein [Balneola sp.]